jgi:multidrug efflux pump subunit AcrA (membrane-fusion protein)
VKPWFRILSLAASAGILCNCGHSAPQHVAQAPFVATTVARTNTIAPGEDLAGVIAPFQNVAVESTLTEPADSVNVQEGDLVHNGQLLAQLDTADLQASLQQDLAQASSDQASTTHNVYAGDLSIQQGVDAVGNAQTLVRQAQANLQRDQTDLQRFQSLLKNGYIAEQQVAQQQTTVNNDQQTLRSNLASLSAAQSNVHANGSSLAAPGLQSSTIQASRAQEQVAIAQANQIRVQIKKATIVSPIDGVVVNRNLNPGEYPGTRQIFTLQQVNPVYAILHGSAGQIAKIASGARATISVPGLTGSRTGSVAGVLNQIVPGSTDFEVKVVLDNPNSMLRPGAVVAGHVALPRVSGITVPQTAFVDDNHNTVLVVQNGVVKTVPVTDVADAGSISVVTGLSPGTTVVSDGQTSVGDGEKVAVR